MGPRFLTLPFAELTGMKVLQGWLWVGCCHAPVHGGIDYIKGKIDRPATWKSFAVVAAAPGRACAGLDGKPSCGWTGTGNRIIIRHRVDGQTWYTYYGHLKWMDPAIPIDNWSDFKVARGALIGLAGHSGNPCCVTHLHFQIGDASGTNEDPYDLYARRGRYPDPRGTNGQRAGNGSLFLSNPPRPPDSSSSGSDSSLPHPADRDRAAERLLVRRPATRRNRPPTRWIRRPSYQTAPLVGRE